MNPPTIVVESERVEPVVLCDYLDEHDEQHMLAWLEWRPELAALIVRALEPAEEERRAA